MKLVLDSNVIIAAFAARGLCHSLLEACFYDYTIFLSHDLLTENDKKLKKKIKLPNQIVDEIISFLKNHSQIISPMPLKKRICRDQDDDNVISLAISTKSNYIITGDKDLLVLKNYKSIPIVSPREFWNILQKQQRQRHLENH